MIHPNSEHHQEAMLPYRLQQRANSSATSKTQWNIFHIVTNKTSHFGCENSHNSLFSDIFTEGKNLLICHQRSSRNVMDELCASSSRFQARPRSMLQLPQPSDHEEQNIAEGRHMGSEQNLRIKTKEPLNAILCGVGIQCVL